MLLREMNQLGTAGGLSSFQLAKNIILIESPFSDQFVTPSLKLKRFAIREAYLKDLTECYESISSK